MPCGVMLERVSNTCLLLCGDKDARECGINWQSCRFPCHERFLLLFALSEKMIVNLVIRPALPTIKRKYFSCQKSLFFITMDWFMIDA